MRSYLLIAGLLLNLLPTNGYAQSQLDPSVTALSWMSGTWTGPLGNSTIEEAWTAPNDGSIAAVVRFTRDGSTRMLELIVITEEEGSLVLRMQQYSAQMQPLKESLATLYLTNLEAQRATFVAEDLSGGLKQLIYTREDAETFSVDVTLAEGDRFRAVMTAN